jgi:alpha,alpha-trehalase
METHPGLKLTNGKKVFELQPGMDWHKGTAVRWLLEALELPQTRALPVFLGDDITDENAFAALATDGVGIIVRDEPRQTAARYGLNSTDEVRIFLEQIFVAVQS